MLVVVRLVWNYLPSVTPIAFTIYLSGKLADNTRLGIANNRYCVNTKIKDNTEEVDAIFFNEAMTGMLEVECTDMVVKFGHDDPYAFPDKIMSLTPNPNNINDPKIKIMSLTAKANNPVAINSVSPNDQSAKPLRLQPTPAISTQAIRPPATPAKRQHGTDKAKQA